MARESASIGAGMTVACFAVRPCPSKVQVTSLTDSLIDALGLSKAKHDPTTYNYPVAGKGGVGLSYIQPIMESFIVVNMYSNFEGAYVVICSCVPIDYIKALMVIKSYGLAIVDAFFDTLSLIKIGTE